MNKIFLVFFCALILDVDVAVGKTDLNYRYNWKCGSTSKCTRVLITEDSGPSDDLFPTIEVCRLVCGKNGALWPVPTGLVKLSDHYVPVDIESFRFNSSDFRGATGRLLNKMTSNFLKNIRSECPSHGCVSSRSRLSINVALSVNSDDETLSWDTDESYTLYLSTSGSSSTVSVISSTAYGTRHALETLNQLIAFDGEGLVILSAATISDKPVYPHRGVLLDTARNFEPVETIEHVLIGMAASKMNVFHWHLTDSQSFSFESTRLPQITKFGAYSPQEYYTAKNISHIVELARTYGIRVLLELDAPAHSGNGWQWTSDFGLGNITVCTNQQPWRSYCIQPPCGQMNPANPNLYQLLDELYRDFADLVAPGETLHMGGDEVHFGCWNSSQEIVNYMQQKGWGRDSADFTRLWGEFQANALERWEAASGRSAKDMPVILWSSHLTDPEWIEQYLPADQYIIQTWVPNTDPLVTQLLNKGYRLIVTTKNAWYLDHGFWGTTQFYQWRTVYQNRLPQSASVLGGEVCMWGEWIDQYPVESRIFPRADAAAERLWADPQGTDLAEVEPRFLRQRKRLIDRGLKPDAITPGWCAQNEGECS